MDYSRKFKSYIVDSVPSIDYNTKAIGANGDTLDATFQFNADLALWNVSLVNNMQSGKLGHGNASGGGST